MLRTPRSPDDTFAELTLGLGRDRPRAAYVYRVGPYGSFVGTAVSDVRVGGPADNEADVAPFNELRSVDPKGTTIPALVWGTTRRSATVVVAVNGTIAGVSPTFTDDRTERRFAMMLPESLLRAGDNHVAAYELDQSAGAPTLHPMGVRAG